mmetsp:Transcript_66836/g.106273  ORF Transcript_66836/g.106273 Transcript_66836/m.106273 type:complete len:293 (-) Transcript_66836:114-992(-)|eukprot:CAMPEP_0197024618 /NCGR_PEP_ID=MMETSP1384-20130603/5130_1 /TAXON_ID=29189 /ORGANISM="Ammonia sp." /LENGTH=292 /DNA_ID=CAMNT_0042453029 /DNA_START=67 /DNA_END=945 /DNA_ORIENTATION=-
MTSTIELKEEIRSAFNDQDAERSRRLHEARSITDSLVSNDDDVDEDGIVVELPKNEAHKNMGDYIKSIIYGGLDGIITTFAIVAGIAGADLSTEVILVLGFANLVADGISMGVGDYLSEVSELEYIYSEKAREQWEFDNFREGEIQEMLAIYKAKGIEHSDAELILRTMSKYRNFFIDHMLVQELSLHPPNGDEKPIKGGLVTLMSFLCFGCIPLLSYILFAQIEFDGFDPKFVISCCLTVISLFGLGVFKGKITDSSKIKSGAFIAFNGVLAAGAAYAIAFGLSHLTGVQR